VATRGWSRRDFLGAAATCGVALVSGGTRAQSSWLSLVAGDETTLAKLLKTAPVARYWVSTSSARTRDDCLSCHTASELPVEAKHAHESKVVKCLLCAQFCTIGVGERGRCNQRINVDGTLRTLSYGHPVSVHVDPIEKKPLYHFLPGRSAFSLATSGCALSCKFCQNWEISQARPEDFGAAFIKPDEVVEAAARRRAPIIAFTYNEPTVFTEYLTDIARLARKKEHRSVLISCGFMNEAPLTEMCEVLDAIKIDLKGFSEEFYRTVCSAELQPVLRSIKQVAKSDTHLELVNLVVPTLNDSPKMMTELAKWVVGETAHAGGHPGARAGDRHGAGRPLRLRGQRAGSPG